MRMNDEQYFRSCVAQERHLAQLLGHRNIEECYENAGTLWDHDRQLPKWTRDWQACGPLLAKYELAISYGHDDADASGAFVQVGCVKARFSDHPNRERAILYAAVKAVIHLLEHPADRKTHSPQDCLSH